MRRASRLLAVVAGVLVLASSAAPAPPVESADDAAHPPLGAGDQRHWVGAWATAPVRELQLAHLLVRDQSYRMIARLTLGGSRLRVRLSNLYGSGPVTFGHVRVARRMTGAAVAPATDRVVRFAGRAQITVPAGRGVVSDPVDLPVRAGTEVAVSLHVVSGVATRHPLAFVTNYLSPPGSGDVTTDARGAQFTRQVSSTYFLTGIDVWAPHSRGAVVALGDSITDGSSSTPGTHGRWPDVLARRLASHDVGVLNAGISANAVTAIGSRPGGGDPATMRFERDVLGQPGVRALVLLEGTNDLAAGASAEDVIDGLRLIARRARRAGLTVVGATILPRACGGLWSPAAEKHRRAVDDWLRVAPDFDAVADLDAVMRDPSRPACLDPRYDSGDGLHPNQAGMWRIARAMPADVLIGS
ncbi:MULTISPECIES: GDSL-type esterase/lipase family protein [Thermocrispum]|nr:MULTISPECIES: GDSL-type esterase/lipase family protein [Thermocrispum]